MPCRLRRQARDDVKEEGTVRRDDATQMTHVFLLVDIVAPRCHDDTVSHKDAANGHLADCQRLSALIYASNAFSAERKSQHWVRTRADLCMRKMQHGPMREHSTFSSARCMNCTSTHAGQAASETAPSVEAAALGSSCCIGSKTMLSVLHVDLVYSHFMKATCVVVGAPSH